MTDSRVENLKCLTEVPSHGVGRRSETVVSSKDPGSWIEGAYPDQSTSLECNSLMLEGLEVWQVKLVWHVLEVADMLLVGCELL